MNEYEGAKPLTEFLISLVADDFERLAQYLDDPEATIEGSGLPEQLQRILRNGSLLEIGRTLEHEHVASRPLMMVLVGPGDPPDC
jgi:hypothetical protein